MIHQYSSVTVMGKWSLGCARSGRPVNVAAGPLMGSAATTAKSSLTKTSVSYTHLTLPTKA